MKVNVYRRSTNLLLSHFDGEQLHKIPLLSRGPANRLFTLYGMANRRTSGIGEPPPPFGKDPRAG